MSERDDGNFVISQPSLRVFFYPGLISPPPNKIISVLGLLIPVAFSRTKQGIRWDWTRLILSQVYSTQIKRGLYGLAPKELIAPKRFEPETIRGNKPLSLKA